MIEGAGIGDGVKRRALGIFDLLAEVEGRLHGVKVEDVEFHEVGAVDSIVDVVAAAAALEWLAPTEISCRVVALGHGVVKTAHGLLPVPAPATLELLKGVPVVDGGCAKELTTPTGAAILAASVTRWGEMGAMRVVAAGYGAGTRDLADRPNLVRVVMGRREAEEESGRLWVVEANVDDTTPELLAPLLSDLLTAGARDAWVTSVLMKKGRPGWQVSALCDEEKRGAVEQALFRGSTTIGVRRHAVERTTLPRRIVEVETPFGVVRVKVSGGGDGETAQPEYEDCARLAAERGVPLRRVHAEAVAAYHRRG